MVTAFAAYELEEIEPFTLVMYSDGKLTEARWDGASRHVRKLPADVPQIWSSVTLYDAVMIQQREHWFEDWKAIHQQPSASDIRNFHQTAGNGNTESGLLINRDGFMKTVSVTSIQLSSRQGIMTYRDLLTGQDHFIDLDFKKLHDFV